VVCSASCFVETASTTQCMAATVSPSGASMRAEMRVRPMSRTSSAMNDVLDSSDTIAVAPRTPIPMEMAEPTPACRKPSRADALPASLEKGAMPMAAALG
jgi:hypothetical protein